MVSPAMDMLSVFITPWMKPTSSHCATSSACARDHRFEQRAVGVLRRRGIRVVAGDDVVGQQPHALPIAARREELEGADADMAGGDARQHRAGQHGLAQTVSPVVTAASARVVGMPSAAIASLTRYSRSTGPSAARPSPRRENGVGRSP